jgi:hypothetical protein
MHIVQITAVIYSFIYSAQIEFTITLQGHFHPRIHPLEMRYIPYLGARMYVHNVM